MEEPTSEGKTDYNQWTEADPKVETDERFEIDTIQIVYQHKNQSQHL